MVERIIDREIMDIVKRYVEEISKKFNINEVYLFGSYAKGTENEDSDIDVAVILDSNSDTIDLMVELMILTQNIDLRIEPHPISKEDYEKIATPFVQEVIDTGIKVA